MSFKTTLTQANIRAAPAIEASMVEEHGVAEILDNVDRYWRVANYLSMGQIDLLDNPLLKEPQRLEHIQPRLSGQTDRASARL